jgi:hypothetical protein
VSKKIEHSLIAGLIVQIEAMEDRNMSNQILTQIYELLDTYPIYEESTIQNIKQRIEYGTEYSGPDSVRFQSGFEVLEESKKFRITTYLYDKNFRHKQIDYPLQIENDEYILTIFNNTYSYHIPDGHTFLCLSVRPVDEKENISLQDSIEIRKTLDKIPFHKVDLKFRVYNGIDDPLLNAKVVNCDFNMPIDKELKFPTCFDKTFISRSKWGVFYPLHQLNIMSYMVIDINVL